MTWRNNEFINEPQRNRGMNWKVVQTSQCIVEHDVKSHGCWLSRPGAMTKSRVNGPSSFTRRDIIESRN